MVNVETGGCDGALPWYTIAFRLRPIATRNDECVVPSADRGMAQDNAPNRWRPIHSHCKLRKFRAKPAIGASR
jgi:hypothetical protein